MNNEYAFVTLDVRSKRRIRRIVSGRCPIDGVGKVLACRRRWKSSISFRSRHAPCVALTSSFVTSYGCSSAVALINDRSEPNSPVIHTPPPDNVPAVE
ncbi:hypothetical protein Mapa_014263 [Marchantia paleacea]|nr:hypothetical protein Mapa_014263 [Marchantia paleacea]